MKLGRYEVVRELGKGAMGIVYLAKDPLIGRLVALKTIRAAMHADDDETKEFQQRFIREAQAAGILNHPAIVTVHDIGQDDTSGVNFIAMEYVEGNNLKEVLNQGKPLTYEQIADIVAQVAEALDFAHAKGIVHRDVKPANIILLDGQRAKITDFGIAKIASGAANLTTTGQFLGTPNYMAPEQVKGAPVDGRTDIFALGICLYECLTRRKPFGGDSLTSISYKIVHEPFPSLLEINPQIPQGFEDVVSQCLEKDPSKRFQRARDMAVALRAVARGERPVRQPAEPMLADETMVTRDRAAAPPTIEVPFPAAMELSPDTRAHSGAAVAVAPPPPPTVATPAAPAVPKAPAVPASQRLRSTLTNVRALPMWRRRISPPLFIGIVALLVVVLLGGVVALRAFQPKPTVVDPVVEARRAKERQLRMEGDELLRQGRVPAAYAKYKELQRLAPNSPYVANLLQKLDAMRLQEESSKQTVAQAQAKYQEGLALFNDKKYPDAIARFQEALLLNPTAPEIPAAIASAQQEQQKLDAARLARQQQRTTGHTQTTTPVTQTTGTTGSTTTHAPAAAAEPAQMTTLFTHPFTDGRILVRVGGDVVANEALFTDKPARLFRRATRVARPISVSHPFPAKNADVDVMITVPADGVNERHSIPGVRFEGGSSYRLTVRYDATTKKFTYELN